MKLLVLMNIFSKKREEHVEKTRQAVIDFFNTKRVGFLWRKKITLTDEDAIEEARAYNSFVSHELLWKYESASKLYKQQIDNYNNILNSLLLSIKYNTTFYLNPSSFCVDYLIKNVNKAKEKDNASIDDQIND